MADVPRRIANEAIAVAERQAGDPTQSVRRTLEGAQPFAEREVAFAADDDVHADAGVLVDVRREARIVAADDDVPTAGARGRAR